MQRADRPGRHARSDGHQKILVLCRPYLGDTVLMGPLFRNLRAWMPNAHIAAAGYVGLADGLSLLQEIDEIITIRKVRAADESRAAFSLYWTGVLREIRAAGYHLVYDVMQTDKSALICLASAAPLRAGFIERKRRLRHSVYTHVAVWTEAEMQTTHYADLYMKPLELLGAPIHTRSISIALPAEEAEAGCARLHRAVPDRSGPLVAVHPGASALNREWPPEHFAAACDFVQTHLGAHVVLMGGRKEAEALEVIRSAMRTSAPVLEGPLSTREFAAVLAAADLFFGNNSGPMHLAAAVGTPVVAVFDAAVPAQWRPLGENHSIVLPQMPCACLYPDLCRPPHQSNTFCVRTVPRDRVFGALARHLTERLEVPIARPAP